MKILVVRRDNIGDLICTTPLIAALRQAYPSAYIAALVNSYNAPVLEGNADLDQVYVYSKYKHVRGEQPRLAWVYSRLKLLWQLRRQQFDWAILARTGFDIHGLRFAHQIKPKKILGFAPIDRTEPLLTVPVAEGPGEHEHEVELTFRLLDALGIHAAPGPLKLAVPSLAKQELADRAPELFTKKPLIAFHISAREESRQWPINKWQALGRFVLEKTAYNILLLWAPGKSDDPLHPGDDDLAESLRCELASISPDRMLAIPTQTLGELAVALEQADIVVCSDGGALHVAAGVGTPVLGFFENHPVKYNHWYPWQVPCRVLKAPVNHVDGITIEEAIESVCELMSSV